MVRLLVDFDLEAPGIDEFEYLSPPAGDQQKGLGEYIMEYRKSGVAPLLDEFVYRVGSNLYVMRAGRRDRAYRRFLAEIDWDDFFKNEDGQLFFDNLRSGAAKALNCVHLLIDTRTGLTEVAGVCLGYLADAVVIVFQPTTAHQRGLAQVVQELHAREKREERSIPRLYVASKMPVGFENEPNDDSKRLAREIVSQCESRDEHFEAEIELDGGEIRYRLPEAVNRPTLLCLPVREHVRDPHKPDSYRVPFPDREWDLDELSHRYALVTEWIRETHLNAVDELEKRTDATPGEKFVAKVVELHRTGHMSKILQENPESTGYFCKMAASHVKDLAPEERATLVRILRELKLLPTEGADETPTA